jgi:hypothetical protein
MTQPAHAHHELIAPTGRSSSQDDDTTEPAAIASSGDASSPDQTMLPEKPGSGPRWKPLLGLLGIVGLAIAAFSTVDDAREALPRPGPVAVALALQVVAVVFVARAWIALFPPTADRALLARGLYTSQLTKYLPAGGFVQAASQVTLSRHEGVVSAALRLPVFSACAVVAAATVSSGLVFDTDLPGWARMVAGLGLATVVLLDRRVLQGALRIARRMIRRLPEPDSMPTQPAIIRCYAALLVNQLAYSLAFALLLGDISDVPLATSMAAFCGGWVLGYLALPLPSGIGLREAVLVAALPGVGGSVLAASVAHRLIGFVAEASLATTAQLRSLTAGHRWGHGAAK